MLSLKWGCTTKEYDDLVAISMVMSHGKRLSCRAFGCSNDFPKHHIFDDEFQKSCELSILYQSEKSTNESECINAVEQKLEDMINLGFEELLSKDACGQAPGPSKHKRPDDTGDSFVQSVRISIDGKSKKIIDNLNEFSYIRVSVVLRGGGQGAFAIANGYTIDNKKQITWLNKKLDSDCKILVELA